MLKARTTPLNNANAVIGRAEHALFRSYRTLDVTANAVRDLNIGWHLPFSSLQFVYGAWQHERII